MKQITIEKACELVTDGTHYTPLDIGEGIPFLTVKDITSSGLNFERCSKISIEEYQKADAGNSSPKIGDVLFSKDGTVGKVHVVKEDQQFAILSSVAILRPQKNLLDSDYFGYVLKSKATIDQAVRKKTGSAIRRIILKDLKNVKIPLPPLEEQKRIAAILDKSDRIRRKRQEAIQLTEELARSLFLDMFGDPVTNPKGWEVNKVIEHCDCIVPGRDKPKSFTGETPWITTADLNFLQKTYYSRLNIGLSKEEIETVRAKIIPKGSVLLTCVGDLGITSIAGCDMVINQQLHSFQCRDFNNFFVMYALTFQKSFMYKRATQTTVPYINKTSCNSIPIICPPQKLQNKFSILVSKINKQKIIYKNALQESENLFNSLLQRAFRGDL
ncbi:restriction endonuclease subunit S [Spirulina sp. 06S082]|uniref:restriction endonuclease subunit S n=1 Tax=Spirulina sp. 06S082 TaxID=3110248 RepID=UPI002B209C71|nr:restriction endonuclease subunit S [Spirulina sp. 06S082]MEA5467953.1 restriction endonuclease subunit S [Spirulina sp. 06S082]